jgi:hypothetical protein
MDLANMRQQGVRNLIAYCLNNSCRHQAHAYRRRVMAGRIDLPHGSISDRRSWHLDAFHAFMPKAFSGQPAMVAVTYRPQANAYIVDRNRIEPSRAHHLGQPRNLFVKLLAGELADC